MTSLSSRVDQFLCAALRGEKPPWPETDAEDFEQIFLQRSLHHGVQALVFYKSRNTGQQEAWPQKVREQLAGTLRLEAALDLFCTNELTGFLEELSRRNIAFLVTKGAALAQTHYPSSSLRPRVDTDLFIDFGDIENIRMALLESAYEVIPPIYKSHQFMGVSKRICDVSIIFDIHWRILNAPRFARTISFKEAQEQSVPLPGMDGCRTLNQVNALLLACMHRKGSEYHDQDRLIWLYDIHLLISAMTPGELEAFAQKAVDRNVLEACLDGLRRAQARFHTKAVDEVIDKLVLAKPDGTAARRFSDSNLSLLIDDMKCLPNMQSRLDLVGELFFPSPDFLMRKYGKGSWIWLPLLYLHQVVGGIVKRLSFR